MIREALQYIVGLGKTDIHEENGQKYSGKQLYLLEEPTTDPLNVHTLTGLVDYLKSEFDGNEEVVLQVLSPTEVRVESKLNNDSIRNRFIVAKALLPDFNFNYWYNTEDFNIKLQSCFEQNNDRDVMLKVVGNIKEEDVKTFGDDGVSQSVVAKTGVAQVGNVEVPNPVKLAPYRTFVEVEQPESEFIFRMRKGPNCAIFEADGGAWKNDAIDNIQEFLHSELKEQIELGRITIIA